MLNIKLSENDKIMPLRSYTPAQFEEIAAKEEETRQNGKHDALLQSRLYTLGVVYPERIKEIQGWPLSAIAELYHAVVGYSIGGQAAVKNLLTSGNGTSQEA